MLRTKDGFGSTSNYNSSIKDKPQHSTKTITSNQGSSSKKYGMMEAP